MTLKGISENNEALRLYQELKMSSREDSLMRMCMFNNCGETTINSHIVQSGKFLNKLAEKQHLITMEINNPFISRKKGLIDFKPKGINETLSLPLFCQDHDNKIFGYIEKKDIFHEDYLSALLISYRSLCAELRKKIFNHYFGLRLINDEFLLRFLSESDLDYIHKCIKIDHTSLFNDLEPVKRQLEGEIIHCMLNKEFEYGLEFDYEKFGRIEICTSAILSYFPNGDYTTSEIPGGLFVHILPFDNYTVKLVCMHNKFSNRETIEAFNSWNSLDEIMFQKKLSFGIMNKFETWAMKPSFYNSLTDDKKKLLKTELVRSRYSEEIRSEFSLNLFE